MPKYALVLVLLASAVGSVNSAFAADSDSAPSKTAGSTTARPGPFGLAVGMSLAELRTRGVIVGGPGKGGNVYEAQVPKPNSAFEKYAVVVSSHVGLCKVVAVGKDIETSVYGTELVGAFDTLAEALQAKYGEAKKFDFLKSGSIWHEPNEWMTSLRKKERNLVAAWGDGEKSATDGIRGIILEAKALSDSKGYLVVTYEFDNFATCVSERKAVEKDSL